MPLKLAKPPQGRQVCLTSLISLKMLSMSWGRIGFSAHGSCNSSMKLRRAIAASTRTGSSLHAATVKPPCKIMLGQNHNYCGWISKMCRVCPLVVLSAHKNVDSQNAGINQSNAQQGTAASTHLNLWTALAEHLTITQPWAAVLYERVMRHAQQCMQL